MVVQLFGWDRVGITANARVLADIGVPIDSTGCIRCGGSTLDFYCDKMATPKQHVFRVRNLPTHELIKKNSPAKIPLQSTEDITDAISTIDIVLEKQRVMFAYICQGG